MFDDTTDRDKAQLREVLDLDRRARTVSCGLCGFVLATYYEGERVPASDHVCPDVIRDATQEGLAERRDARGSEE